jgi:predicted DNA-binding protein with PD1-like motif
MKTKQLQGGEKTFVLVFETGDEVMSGLVAFARSHALAASRFTAIGALSEVTLGFFDWRTKAYRRIPVREQVEVLSLVGHVTRGERGKPKSHAHVVVGKADGSAHGGHLVRARVDAGGRAGRIAGAPPATDRRRERARADRSLKPALRRTG